MLNEEEFQKCQRRNNCIATVPHTDARNPNRFLFYSIFFGKIKSLQILIMEEQNSVLEESHPKEEPDKEDHIRYWLRYQLDLMKEENVVRHSRGTSLYLNKERRYK